MIIICHIISFCETTSTHAPDITNPILIFIKLIVPEWKTWGTLFYCFSGFIASLISMKIFKLERVNRKKKGDISSLSFMTSESYKEVQKAQQLLKNFRYLHNFVTSISFLLLGILASTSTPSLLSLIPYQVIFSINSVSDSNRLTKYVQLSFLLIDLPTTYLLNASNLQKNYLITAVGLSYSENTFLLKVLLFLFICYQMRYSDSFLNAVSQISNTQKQSYVSPYISKFIYNSTCILFALWHPSYSMLIFLPIMIYALIAMRNYKILMIIIALQIMIGISLETIEIVQKGLFFDFESIKEIQIFKKYFSATVRDFIYLIILKVTYIYSIEDNQQRDHDKNSQQVSYKENNNLLDTSQDESVLKSVQIDESFIERESQKVPRISLNTRIYTIFTKTGNKFLDLSLIHSSKLSLLVLFMVSTTSGPTILNAMLFILFLILSIISKNQRNYWLATIIINTIIIISKYAYEIVPLDILQSSLLGLSQINESRISKYGPYLFLEVVVLITYHILDSKQYLDLQNSDESLKTDPLTSLILQNSVYLTTATIFLDCYLNPHQLPNLALLALMSVQFLIHLRSKSCFDTFHNSRLVLQITKWVCAIIILAKYIGQFEQEIENQFGPRVQIYFFEDQYKPIKLFGIALVLTINSLQLRVAFSNQLQQVVKDQDERFNQFLHSDKGFWNKIKIYFSFSAMYLFKPMPIIFLVRYISSNPTLINLFLLILIMLSLSQSSSNFWSTSYLLISYLITFSLLFTYALYLTSDQYFSQTLDFYPFAEILAICTIQKALERIGAVFNAQSDHQNQLIFYLCQLRDVVILPNIQNFCLLALQCVGLVTITAKSNFTSIVYLVILLRITGYFSQRQQRGEQPIEESAKIQAMRWIRVQMIVIGIVMIGEYIMIIGNSTINEWKEKIVSQLCEDESRECREEWKQWLSIGSMPKGFLIIDFIYLLITLFTRSSIENQVEQEPIDIKIGDDSDFMRNQEAGNRSLLMQFLFSGFPYFVIIVLLVYSTSSEGEDTSELISIIYLFFAFYFIINFRKFYTKNSKILNILRYYNYLVLIITLAFQIPLFACPGLDSPSRFDLFITNKRCVALQQASLESQQSELTFQTPQFAFYLILMKSLGLFKHYHDLQLPLIILILLCEIQNYLFQHPYYKVYVLGHMLKERQIDGRFRAYEYVQRTHLKTQWAYKAIKEEIRILHSRLVRITQGIKESEHSKHLIEDSFSQGELDEEDTLIQDGQESAGSQPQTIIEKLMKEHASVIEELAIQRLSGNEERPVVPLKMFMKEFHQYLTQKFGSKLNSEESLQIDNQEILQYIQQIADQLEKEVELNSKVNLIFRKGLGMEVSSEVIEALQKGERSFYQNMIGLEVDYNQEQNLQTIQAEIKEEKSLNQVLRGFIFNNFIDRSLLLSLTLNIHTPTQYTIQLSTLLALFLLSISLPLFYFSLFLSFILNCDIISLLPAFSVLFFALLTDATPTYLRTIQLYLLLTLLIKFVYQLPVFGMNISYGNEAQHGFLEILGIKKYANGILNGMMPDFISLIMLLIVKHYMVKVGRWNYVRQQQSIYDTPSFKGGKQENHRYRLYKEAMNQSQSLWQRINLLLAYRQKQIKGFFLKLLPMYMKPSYQNRDSRTCEATPILPHIVKRVKPGKDHFTASFFSLLCILALNLFFFRSITGESHAQALSSANLQRFSIPQVIILFCLLFLMMAERMLYRARSRESNGLGEHQLMIKLVLHVILVLIVHIELGLLIPRQNPVKFPLILNYLLWVHYFVHSSLQIKHGYPQAPFKAPFVRDTSFFTIWAFRIYKAVPFLWEMKVIIDWTVTGTCLDLFQWFKLDDAFNYLYQCQMQNNDRGKRRGGYYPRPCWEKFFQGFCFAFALILVILAPILLFSGINPIMVKNPVVQGEMQMTIELNQNGNSYSILQTQAFNIQSLTQEDFNSIQNMYSEGSTKFEMADMQKMYFSPYSELSWSISPPSLQKLISDFNSSTFFEVKTQLSFRRENPIGNELAGQELKTRLGISALGPVIDMLQYGDNQTSRIEVPNVFPKLLKLGATQQTHLLDVIPTYPNYTTLGSASLILNQGQKNLLFWTYDISQGGGLFQNQSSSNLVLVVYNEQVIGSLFGTALQLSVVGLYATIVIAIGRFLRLVFDRISQRVIYEEMDPETTEQLFEICEGIYIAQLEGDMAKEKKFYDLLIRIYRSPETLIKINRKKLRHQQTTTQMGQKIII